jgi:PAS domain S-box-containing protein
MWGYKREELIGRTPLELGFWPVPEDRERFIADLQRDGVVHGREFRLARKDGELRDILASAALIDLKGKKFSLFQSLDITERKQAERLLEESESRLAKIIEASPEAITIVSVEDGTFVAVNPAGEKICGYTHEELIGNSALKLGFYPDPEEREAILADLQRNEVVHGREIHLRRKNGEVRDILTSAALIEFRGRKLILFQAVDITERKDAEQALKEHQLMLRELSAHHDAVREGERARIAREVHDELGQALTALKMELSVLGIKFGEAVPEVKEPVQALKGRVDSIIQTVRHVATALRPAALDLGFLPGVEWVVGEFRRRTGIHCTVSLTGNNIDLPEDRSIVLFRILQESLTNISRHAKARKVEILLDHDAEYVRMDVQDDGVGFDVEAARGRKTFGLLGMRERAIMLRGEMRITSAPGQGTRVSVSMPIA